MIEEEVIYSKLTRIIIPYIPDKELVNIISKDSDLLRDLKVNSAHIIDIVLEVESMFDIIIDENQISKMNTLNGAIEVILSKLNESSVRQ